MKCLNVQISVAAFLFLLIWVRPLLICLGVQLDSLSLVRCPGWVLDTCVGHFVFGSLEHVLYVFIFVCLGISTNNFINFYTLGLIYQVCLPLRTRSKARSTLVLSSAEVSMNAKWCCSA